MQNTLNNSWPIVNTPLCQSFRCSVPVCIGIPTQRCCYWPSIKEEVMVLARKCEKLKCTHSHLTWPRFFYDQHLASPRRFTQVTGYQAVKLGGLCDTLHSYWHQSPCFISPHSRTHQNWGNHVGSVLNRLTEINMVSAAENNTQHPM